MSQRQIEQTLKIIDFKFYQEMNHLEKQKAYQLFKFHYVQQLGKATKEILKNQKVQQNKQQIQQRKKIELEQVQEALIRKMATHQSNRQKINDKKIQEYHHSEEIWKNKWEDICRKKRIKDQSLIQKAQERWKESQAFWQAKTEAEKKSAKKSPTKTSQQISPIKIIPSSEKNAFVNQNYKIRSHRIKHRSYDTLVKTDKDKLGQLGIKFVQNTIAYYQKDVNSPNKNQIIAKHQEKHQAYEFQQQSSYFEAYINKLKKIQEKRQRTFEVKQKQIAKAKQQRQERQNPEVLQRNRKISEGLYSRKTRNRQSHQQPQSFTLASTLVDFNPRNLSKTGVRQRTNKNKIKQIEACQRQQQLNITLQKIRTAKLQRLVKQVVKEVKKKTVSLAK